MRYLLLISLAGCADNLTPQPAPASALPDCLPNRDGQITADEMPVAIGATLNYYVSTDVPVDLAAKNGIWDLSAERAADTVVALGPTALGPQWYAASFPAGQFVVDAGSGLDGVYHQTNEALWLDGTASQAMSPKTLIRYTDPVAVLRFPIADGDAYSATAQIPDGVISDLPFVGTDQIDVDVTGNGRLDVPYVRFSPALRVREHVVRKPTTGTPTVGRRTTLFLFECFGEVARAESKQDESAADFTTATLLRRFALGQEAD